MRWVLIGAVLMLSGLGLLLAMVVHLIEPALSLSLAGYAATFVGAALVTAGVVERRWRG